MTFVNKNLIIIIVIEIRMEMLAEILWLARVKLHMRESFCSDSPAHPLLHHKFALHCSFRNTHLNTSNYITMRPTQQVALPCNLLV